MKERLNKILVNIANNTHDQSVTVLAATKCVDVDTINGLCDLGITEIGENRVQELLEKYGKVDERLNWHFIGRLQTNKVKYIVDKVVMIQSVDSVKLADEIQKQCEKNSSVMPVLVEVNMGGEADKGGVDPAAAQELCKYVAQLKNLRLRGIMCVFPKDADDSLYENAKRLFDGLAPDFDGFDTLSMGMSNDYEIAVKYGSNMVRIGSALFGPRNYERIK